MNYVISITIDYILGGDLHGVDGVDPYGRTINIFRSHFFFGYYLNVPSKIYVMGHTSLKFLSHISIYQ